jgi:hypothetical protein
MRAWFLLFLILFITYSCTKKAEFNSAVLNPQFSNVEMPLTHLKPIEWRVGVKRKHEITQSFTFILNLPNADQEDLLFLENQRGIDSWIIRVVSEKGSKSQDLGSLYAPFSPRHLSRGVETRASKSVSIKVFYAAAFASERFRHSHCPEFGHNLEITKLAIMGDNSPFNISLGSSTSYPERSHLIELAPAPFNGGHELTGNYFLEIAPYNSKKKIIHAPFKRIPQYISIQEEVIKPIDRCYNQSKDGTP